MLGKNQTWWLRPVIPVLGRQRQNCKLEASLGCIRRPCLKTNKQTTKNAKQELYHWNNFNKNILAVYSLRASDSQILFGLWRTDHYHWGCPTSQPQVTLKNILTQSAYKPFILGGMVSLTSQSMRGLEEEERYTQDSTQSSAQHFLNGTIFGSDFASVSFRWEIIKPALQSF
jgi:hypothetical protein